MSQYTLYATITLFLVTLITRLSPLLIGTWLEKYSWLKGLGNKLPCMILVLLLIHDVEVRMDHPTSPYEIGGVCIGFIATILIHLWKRQTILSICGGVLFYALISLLTKIL